MNQTVSLNISAPLTNRTFFVQAVPTKTAEADCTKINPRKMKFMLEICGSENVTVAQKEFLYRVEVDKMQGPLRINATNLTEQFQTTVPHCNLTFSLSGDITGPNTYTSKMAWLMKNKNYAKGDKEILIDFSEVLVTQNFTMFFVGRTAGQRRKNIRIVVEFIVPEKPKEVVIEKPSTPAFVPNITDFEKPEEDEKPVEQVVVNIT